MNTSQEVFLLKHNWSNDPCWNIETTEGFEEYHDELLSYSEYKKSEWAEEREHELREFAASIGMSSNLAMARYIRQLEQRIEELENKQ